MNRLLYEIDELNWEYFYEATWLKGKYLDKFY
ncbi:hypothetical protein Fleli_3829 [Bernardetia litoralis DSM 6794]|uniref:Uncharacterized protein n=1 Tax=Bernardetia litoralis (strain ATCC 23117 / DSM 6794 / NBRC 15988 / NCIMB 1366 / Fx l1 / Sio-4) TaxID=880071 RepID=I4AQA0_BERLS|nr:hypothetical protein Fleli_3829 [Bernardetia litoralis DSM 6794]